MFKIGEFSKIAQVSGHLLRYYDEIGLLTPAKIDEWTGYRYYSATQLPRLNRILALKEIGLSLDQVRRMLDEAISADEIRGMFALKKAQLEQSIREDLLNLQSIEARLQRIDEGNVTDDFDVIVKSVPAQHILGIRDTFNTFNEARQIFGEMQMSLPRTISPKSVGHLTVILHNEAYGEDTLDLEMGFAMATPFDGNITLSKNRRMTMHTLPAISQMVTAVRIGSPATSHTCRASLATWVETNGFEFAGNGREVFIVPPMPGKEHETVMEIQYPIVGGNVMQLSLN